MGVAGWVLGGVLGLTVAIAWWSDRRDRADGTRRRRDAATMWRRDMREHRRDARASDAAGHVYQDRRWTRDAQRRR